MLCAAGLFALSACLPDRLPLRPGDLLFQVAGGGDMSAAIAQATAGGDTAAVYDHVGIYMAKDGRRWVLEATPRAGVTCTPLEEFLRRGPAVAMRYEDPEVADRAPWAALALYGRPYDWRYAPGADSVYCSELVQLAFTDQDSVPLFPSAPMNFLDERGELPAFWRELYDSLGCPVPQGQPGTNPTAMSRDPRLRRVWQSF